MNDTTNSYSRARKIGGVLAASMLAVGLPAVASAQADQAMPAWSTESQASGALTQDQQLDELQSIGFLDASNVGFANVGSSGASTFGPMRRDKLRATLHAVQVNTGMDSAPDTLRAYLANNGVAPSSVVGVVVSDSGSVVILHS